MYGPPSPAPFPTGGPCGDRSRGSALDLERLLRSDVERDLAVDLGIVKKSGAWFTYEGEQLGQGRENAKQFLAENVDMTLDIMEKVKVAAGIGADDGEDDALTDEEISLDSE